MNILEIPFLEALLDHIKAYFKINVSICNNSLLTTNSVAKEFFNCFTKKNIKLELKICNSLYSLFKKNDFKIYFQAKNRVVINLVDNFLYVEGYKTYAEMTYNDLLSYYNWDKTCTSSTLNDEELKQLKQHCFKECIELDDSLSNSSLNLLLNMLERYDGIEVVSVSSQPKNQPSFTSEKSHVIDLSADDDDELQFIDLTYSSSQNKCLLKETKPTSSVECESKTLNVQNDLRPIILDGNNIGFSNVAEEYKEMKTNNVVEVIKESYFVNEPLSFTDQTSSKEMSEVTKEAHFSEDATCYNNEDQHNNQSSDISLNLSLENISDTEMNDLGCIENMNLSDYTNEIKQTISSEIVVICTDHFKNTIDLVISDSEDKEYMDISNSVDKNQHPKLNADCNLLPISIKHIPQSHPLRIIKYFKNITDEEHLQLKNKVLIEYMNTPLEHDSSFESRHDCNQSNSYIDLAADVAGSASSVSDDKSLQTKTNIQKICENSKPLENRSGLRPIILDASNIAFSHGCGNFNPLGISIAVNYFLKLGHRIVYALIPRHRQVDGGEIFEKLEKSKNLIYTPSRVVNNKRETSYDDKMILDAALGHDGVVISNDQFRDLFHITKYKDIIINRLIPYAFVGDLFMIPDDPRGQLGPHLSTILSFNPIESQECQKTIIKKKRVKHSIRKIRRSKRLNQIDTIKKLLSKYQNVLKKTSK